MWPVYVSTKILATGSPTAPMNPALAEKINRPSLTRVFSTVQVSFQSVVFEATRVDLTMVLDALAQVSGGSIVATASVTALASGISQVSASRTSRVSASQTSQASASRSSQASATTQGPSTITETGVALSTASVVVAYATDSAGRNVTSTIGGLVAGGVAITTTDSRGTTFVTTASALPPAGGNSTANTASLTEVPVTTTNSLGSTVVTTVSDAFGSIIFWICS